MNILLFAVKGCRSATSVLRLHQSDDLGVGSPSFSSMAPDGNSKELHESTSLEMFGHNHLMDFNGQIRTKTLPIKSDRGTVPHIRLSQEFECESPIMK